MALLWIFALMTAAALCAVVWPLASARRVAAGPSDLAVYRDQLEEIERDRADGRIGHDEFDAARVEVSRRLLAAANAEGQAPAATGDVTRRRITAMGAAVIAIPLIAVLLYGLLGSPDLPGRSIAALSNDEHANSIAGIIARIEAHLEEEPSDGRGWEVVAPVYMKLERYDDAVKARRNALNLLGATPAREVDLGEALTAAAGGVVTAEAKDAFDRAIAGDGDSFKAMFYLGLAAQQDGKSGEAVRIWRDLIGKSPPDAPWLTVVRESMARVEGTEVPQGPVVSAAPARGPTAQDVAAADKMTADERNQFIRDRVESLAVRLRQDGSDIEGWLRLLNAYKVLGDRDKAKAAADEARKALAREPDKLRQLDQGIKELGVGG
jgi:cytochrome c-type biogenesis protein CcmH